MRARQKARSTPADPIGASTDRAHRAHPGTSLPVVPVGKRRRTRTARRNSAGLRKGLRSRLRRAGGNARTSAGRPVGAVRHPARRKSPRPDDRHEHAVRTPNAMAQRPIPSPGGDRVPLSRARLLACPHPQLVDPRRSCLVHRTVARDSGDRRRGDRMDRRLAMVMAPCSAPSETENGRLKAAAGRHHQPCSLSASLMIREAERYRCSTALRA